MKTLHARMLVLGSMLAVVVPAVASSQAADPSLGTWELNVAKSTWSPGPGPKSDTRTYTAAPNGYKLVSKGVGADGKPTAASLTVAFDGKFYPITGSPTIDSVSTKRIDANTFESQLKKGNKVMSHSTRVVAKDGKSFTTTSTGTDAAGKPFKNTVVYDKK
jgi:hypothetical protein